MSFHKTGLLPAIIVAALALLIAPASASSFMVLGSKSPAPSPSPSIMVMGEPVAPAVEARLISTNADAAGDDTSFAIYQIAPSVIAFGAEAIPKSPDMVAAIGQHPHSRHFNSEAFPMVIRGGIIGDAIIRPSAPVTTVTQPQPPQPQSDPAASETADSGAAPPAEPMAERPAPPTLEAR